jgi:hypothetical protein
MARRSAPQPTLEEQIATLQTRLAALLETGADTASLAAREARASGAAAAAAARDRVELATAGLAIAGLVVLSTRGRDPTAEAAERTRDIALAGLAPTLASPAGLVALAGLAAELVQGLRRS